MKIKSTDAGKRQRKKIRAVKKGLVDTEIDKEGTESYVAGGF